MDRFLPTRKEWEMMFDTLSKREKAFFIVLFLAAWTFGTLLLIKIDTAYSTRVPADGGSLVEGIVGTPRFINPLLALSDADRDLTRIIYGSLLKSDGKGNLETDLASSYEVSEDGLSYTFHLRDHLLWHDGQPITSADVAYTVEQAKNPVLRSPRLANWEGITIETPDDKTVIFHLKKPFTPFLESATMGILPKHVWASVTSEQFSLSTLNTHPVGSGPFSVDTITKNSAGSIVSYSLKRFPEYQPHPAHITSLTFRFYSTDKELSEALQSGSVTLASVDVHTPPAGLTALDIQLPRVVGIFFNQDSYAPLGDLVLRNALKDAIDRKKIITEVKDGHAKPTSLPLPPGMFGYDESIDAIDANIENAKTNLKAAGYADSDGDGIIDKKLSKKDKDVTNIHFTIATLNTPELIKTAEIIHNEWKELGVDVTVQVYEQGDLEQNIIRPRNYDALLFGQALGYVPDPFAFWHTSQRAHPGLNLALYANTKVDKALEDERITIDENKRKELLETFLGEFKKDTPAIILYSPSYTYIIPEYVKGLSLEQIPFPQERFSSIEKWYTREESVWNIFLKK